MKKIALIGFIFMALGCLAQAPVINSIQPLSAAPTQKIVITGSGFSTTSSNLQVWFDNVKGTITRSSAYSIDVLVPPQARFSNVEVINLSNNLSGKYRLKFLPSFGGSSFDETKISTPFTSVSSLSDPAERFDIATGDLDLDGKPDLIASKYNNINATDLIIYQNSSTGIGNVNFTKIDKSTLSVLNVGANTKTLACGDLNGDGKPDIVAARTGGNNYQLYILKNTNTVSGTLSFTSAASVFLDNGQEAFRPIIRDLNGDGKPELIVSNSFDDNNSATDNQMYIFPNTSNSSTITFGSAIKLTVTGAGNTYGIDVQDFDGDGLADIVVSQFQSNNLYFFRNISTGNISFSPVQLFQVSGSFNSLNTADLNSDGKPDLIATATLDNKVEIWLNTSTTGTISFATGQALDTSVDPTLPAPTNGGPWAVEVSDLDGDGDVDLAVTNRYYAKMNVFRQDSPLSFTKLEIATSRFGRNMKVGDYDGDGKPDFALITFNTALSQYSVDVIRNANCWNPIITAPSNTICNGQTVVLKTKPALGAAFVWKKDGVVQASTVDSLSATVAANAPGYAVTVTGTFDTGCSITSPAFVMGSSANAPPSDPTIIANTACIGSTLNLSSSPSVGGATYAWTGPNNFTSTSATPSINPVTNGIAGTYTLQLTLNGCKSNIASKDVDVASVPILPVTASPSAIACVGASISLNVSGTGYTYQWKKNGTLTVNTGSTLTLSSLSATDEGDYSVVVTNTSTSCSQETAATTVKVFAAPTVDFNFSSPLCAGTSVNFTTDGLTVGDPRGTLTYSWAFGDGHTSTDNNPSNTYASASSWAASLTVKYAEISSGCNGSKLKTVPVLAPVVPSIQATANSMCRGDVVSLSITGSYNSINWSGNGLSGSTSSVDISKPAKYFVSTVDANSCSSKDSITISANPLIPLVVSSDRNNIKLGDTVHLSASGADSYVWTPGKTLNDSTVATPIASPVASITYTVRASKSGYCDSIKTVKITIETGSAVISPPVLFSPNGDTYNETWLIPDAINYPDWTMTVYDGHGSQVYQQKGYTSTNAWDGNYNGKPVPDGAYFYVFSNSKDKPATGSVLVVR